MVFLGKWLIVFRKLSSWVFWWTCNRCFWKTRKKLKNWRNLNKPDSRKKKTFSIFVVIVCCRFRKGSGSVSTKRNDNSAGLNIINQQSLNLFQSILNLKTFLLKLKRTRFSTMIVTFIAREQVGSHRSIIELIFENHDKIEFPSRSETKS